MTHVTFNTPTARVPEYDAPSSLTPAHWDTPDELALRVDADAAALAELNALLSADDSSSLLLALQIAMRDGQIDLGKEGVRFQKHEVDRLFREIAEAMRRAQEAAESSGFFGEVFEKFGVAGKIAALVAVAASVATTGGLSLVAAAAILGMVLSSCSKELADIVGGGELAEKIFLYTGVALSLVAGGVGAFQALGSSGSVVATAGESTFQQIAMRVRDLANMVQTGSTLGQAGSGYMRDRAAADEVDFIADEREARADRAHELRTMEGLIDFLRQVDESFRRSIATLMQAMDVDAQSRLTAARLGGLRA